MKRFLASVSVFALLFGLLPLHPVAAAHADSRLQNFSSAASGSFSSLTGGMGVNADDVSQWSAGSAWSIVPSPSASLSNKVAKLQGPSDSNSGILDFASNPWLEDMRISFKYEILPGAIFSSGDNAKVEWSNDRGATWNTLAEWDLNSIQPTPSGVHTIVSPILPDIMEYRAVQFRATVTLSNAATVILVDDVRFDGQEVNMIEGAVYHDVNGDGTRNDGAESVQDNRTVQLYAVDNQGNRSLVDSMLTGQSNSNTNDLFDSKYVSAGFYRFLNVPDGRYQVCQVITDDVPGLDWDQTSPENGFLDPFLEPTRNIADVESVLDQDPVHLNQYCYELTLNEASGRGQQHSLRFGNFSFADPTPTLSIQKSVVGSSAEVGDFQYVLTVNSVAQAPQDFVVGGTAVTLNAGDVYSVAEVTVDDYETASDAGCAGTVVAGQDVICSVTNTYVPPKGFITLQKVLPNDNGGIETAAAFDYSLDGTPVALGVATELDPGQYDIAEVWNSSHFQAYPNTTTLDTWYDVSYSCTDGTTTTTTATVDLADDQNIVCTITNDDKPASITLTKVISGGPSVPASSFGFTVTGTNVVVDGQGSPASSAVFAGNDAGTQIVLDAGAFTLQEDANPNYISTMSAVECDGIVLVPGQHLDCIATNTYIVVPVVEDGWLQGFFYKDLNANGTYDEGPGFTNRLSGVQVTLYDSSWVELSHMTTGTASATSGSVRPGQYRFRLLPAGVYYVCSADLAPGFDQTSPESGFKDPVLGGSSNVTSVTDPNVAGQYCYGINLAANKHRNLLRFGFQPVNQNPTRELTGAKFEDEDGNGQWDQDEEGIEDWTMYLVTEADGISSFTVDANSEAVGGSQDYTFESGKTYIVRASGTFTAGDSITADAKYSVRDPNTEYTDLVQNYEGFGPTLLELTIDDAAQNWGEFVSGHVYFTKIEGTGDTKTFEIEDIFPSNNQGSLSIQVFEVLQTTQTDDEGDYEFNITGLQDDLYVIEDTNQAGYVQTYPGSPNYMYTVPAGTDDVVENDFGNRQIGRTTPTAEIIPTLSCVENLGEGTYKAHFGYTSANNGVVFIDAGTFENRIVGGGLIGGTDHGQPSSFEPGTQDDDFEVIFAGAIPLTWTVVSTETNSVTADQNSTLCGSHQEPEESTLTVNVGVSGGSAVAGNFHVFLNGAGSELAQGTPMNLAPGSYTLLQTSTVPDYVTSFSGDCVETTTDHAAGDISANEQAVCNITNTYVGQESNGGGGGGGGGNGSGIGPNGGNNGGGGSTDPDPIVLGDSDEVDPGSASDSGNNNPDGSGGSVLPPLPVPEVAGVNDELPRTGVPVAGLLGLGSLLAFWARRREQE